MVDLFGGLRFRWMDLFCVEGMPLLLNACANTLETLQLDPFDSRSESYSLKAVHTPTDGSKSTSIQTLIYPQASHFEHSRFQHRASTVCRRISSQIFSTTRSPQSHPLDFSSSWSSIRHLISIAWNLGRSAKASPHFVRHHERRKSRGTVGCSKCSVGSVKCGTFSWSCAWESGPPRGSTRLGF